MLRHKSIAYNMRLMDGYSIEMHAIGNSLKDRMNIIR